MHARMHPPACWPPQSFLDYLKNLTADIQIAQGDFDEFTSPEELVSTHVGPNRALRT
jgi:hypothetical protein